MTDAEFEKGFSRLAVLRTGKVSQDLKDLWYDAVYSLPGRSWVKACADWVEENTRFPSIREIKSAAAGCMTPLERGELPEPDLDPQTIAFNRVAVPLLTQYLSKDITRETFLGALRMQANLHGVESRIDWNAFEKPVPWEPQGAPL